MRRVRNAGVHRDRLQTVQQYPKRLERAVLFCSLCNRFDTRHAAYAAAASNYLRSIGRHGERNGEFRAAIVARKVMPEVAATFDSELFLAQAGFGRTVVPFRKGTSIFVQGDDCHAVFFIQEGSIKLSVVSALGKEATISIMNGGDFVGEKSYRRCRV
jgi:hypothetical protein